MTQPHPTTEAAKARLAAGDTFVLATSVTTATSSGGRALTWAWAFPLLVLWRRHERKKERAATGLLLGIPLGPLAVLVLTDRRLLFYDVKTSRVRGRRHRHPAGLLGEIARADVLTLLNTTVGAGWRTCSLTLRDGTAAMLRVPARDLPAVLAEFPAPLADLA